MASEPNCSAPQCAHGGLLPPQTVALETVTARIVSSLAENRPVRLLLRGPRGAGKSLVLEALHDWLTTEHPSFRGRVVLLRDIGLHGLNSFQEQMFGCLDGFAQHNGESGIPSDEHPDKALAARASDGPILLLLDDLPEVFIKPRGKHPSEMIAFLVQNSNIGVVASMHCPALEESARSGANGYNVFETIPLDTVEPEDARRFLLRNAGDRERGDGRLREGIAAAIADMAGGSAEYLAGLAPLLGEQGTEALSCAFRCFVDQRAAPLARARLAELSPQQRRILATLAQSKGQPLSVKGLSERTHSTSQTCSKQLHELHRDGWVRRHSLGRESRYEMADAVGRLALERNLSGSPNGCASFDALVLWRQPLKSTPPEGERFETPPLALYYAANSVAPASEASRVYGRTATDAEALLREATRGVTAADAETASVTELQCLLALGRYERLMTRAHQARAACGSRGMTQVYALFEALSLWALDRPQLALRRQEYGFSEGQSPVTQEVHVAQEIIRGRIHQALGTAGTASKAFTEAFRAARELQGASRFVLIAQSLLEKGALLADSSAFDKALKTFGYAEEAARECDGRAMRALLEGASLFNAGLVYMRSRQYAHAMDALNRALEHAKHCESPATDRIAVKAHLGRAGVHRMTRKTGEAETAYDQATAAAEAIGDPRLTCESLLGKGTLLWSTGRLGEASALHDRVIEALQRDGETCALPELSQALAAKALGCIAEERLDKALGVLGELACLYAQCKGAHDVERAMTLALEGYLCAFGGQEEALQQVRHALDGSNQPFLARACLFWLKRRLPMTPETAKRLAPVQEAMARAFECDPLLAACVMLLGAARGLALGEPAALLELPLEYRGLLDPVSA